MPHPQLSNSSLHLKLSSTLSKSQSTLPTYQLSKTAPEAKSKPAVPPQPNRNRSAGTPAPPKLTYSTAASVGLNTPPPAPSTKATSTQRVTAPSGKGSANGSMMQAFVFPDPTASASERLPELYSVSTPFRRTDDSRCPLDVGELDDKLHPEALKRNSNFSPWPLSSSTTVVPSPEAQVLDVKAEVSGTEMAQMPDVQPREPCKGKDLERPQACFEDHIYLLVDADGCVFTAEVVKLGARNALRAIHDEILKLYHEHFDHKISIYLFMNKKGMRDVIRRTPDYDISTFDNFLNEFQTAGLNFVVDTGELKQSADEKLKEVYNAYIQAPETRNMFLAVGHDGGYGAFLSKGVMECFWKKIILVRYLESRPMAAGVESLNLPTIRLSNLFRDEPLASRPNTNTNGSGKKSSHQLSSSNVLAEVTADLRRDSWQLFNSGFAFGPKLATPQPSRKPSTPQFAGSGTGSNNELWEKPTKPPCLKELFELDPEVTCDRKFCKNLHGLRDDPAEAPRIARLHEYVKLTYPCDKGTQSQCGDVACIRAHVCPYGPSCSLRKDGYCKFSEEMHGPFEDISSSVDLGCLLRRTLQGYMGGFYRMLQRVARMLF
ncbi:hypothetical protein DFP72DRAFT_38518 [Ephemerocybe angulata]|uniref:C3H1-type domain-containing protein n=1 Tax=Ephemerocybe angulata TaxID=980116 RepID=A0A8H6ICM7_9AGAR|nr:hypothetical protein DFP72DRAFT_38518 [Tulosesus angulatus]